MFWAERFLQGRVARDPARGSRARTIRPTAIRSQLATRRRSFGWMTASGLDLSAKKGSKPGGPCHLTTKELDLRAKFQPGFLQRVKTISGLPGSKTYFTEFVL